MVEKIYFTISCHLELFYNRFLFFFRFLLYHSVFMNLHHLCIILCDHFTLGLKHDLITAFRKGIFSSLFIFSIISKRKEETKDVG